MAVLGDMYTAIGYTTSTLLHAAPFAQGIEDRKCLPWKHSLIAAADWSGLLVLSSGVLWLLKCVRLSLGKNTCTSPGNSILCVYQEQPLKSLSKWKCFPLTDRPRGIRIQKQMEEDIDKFGRYSSMAPIPKKVSSGRVRWPQKHCYKWCD